MCDKSFDRSRFAALNLDINQSLQIDVKKSAFSTRFLVMMTIDTGNKKQQSFCVSACVDLMYAPFVWRLINYCFISVNMAAGFCSLSVKSCEMKWCISTVERSVSGVVQVGGGLHQSVGSLKSSHSTSEEGQQYSCACSVCSERSHSAWLSHRG